MTKAADGASIVVLRGDYVESCHRVAFAVARPDGQVVASAGDPDRPILPRSAIKPLQALPLLTTGAADAAGVDAREVAIACGSHSGAPEHVTVVERWLGRLGLDGTALRCGAHPPLDSRAFEALAASGTSPTALHNNCSGKHAGMLTLACHLGANRGDYRDPDHPVQQAIAEVLRRTTGLDELEPPAIDGCGVPTWPLPLAALARAMAAFADPARLDAPLSRAIVRIREAIQQHPEMLAGEGRLCTVLVRSGIQVIAKTGAEGVYTAILPRTGLGLALKVEDGSGRASGVALLALLEALAVLDAKARDRLERWRRPRIRNHAGLVVGAIQPAPEWPALS